MYYPVNCNDIFLSQSGYQPSNVKLKNNLAFEFWSRQLYLRVFSKIGIENLPEHMTYNISDFLKYCLCKFGFVGFFELHGRVEFNPVAITGRDFYYQPCGFKLSNPSLNGSMDFTIGKDGELLKMTPDYMGIWDIINYFAEKLALISADIDISLVNTKLSYLIGAKNKAAGEALKKMIDKVQRGEPAVIFDQKIADADQGKSEPFQFLTIGNVRDYYIVSEQLQDFQTILNQFDTEIGIPTVPYQKKERMVTSEAESKINESRAKLEGWIMELKNSADTINKRFGTNIRIVEKGREEEPDNGRTDASGDL